MSQTIPQLEPRDSGPQTRDHVLVRLVRRLCSPALGIQGEMVRFVIAGGTVAVVYLGSTTLLADVIGLPFEVALILGYLIGLTVHFSLQRLFVWIHLDGFALRMPHQIGRYVCLACVIYGTTALSTTFLPGPLGLPIEVVYLSTAILISCVNFLVFRYRIFHGQPPLT